ncbi:hypothetical protein ACROYT_G033096 [Oculina patagonica]
MYWGLTLVVLTVLQAWLVQSEKVVRVTPEVESHLVFLRGLEKRADIKIDFWKEPSRLFQPVDIEVSEEDFITLSSLLEADGIEFKVQIDDVHKLIEKQLETIGAKGGGGGWHSQYHKLAAINSKLYQVHNNYRNMTSIINLGRSHKKRQMRAIKIQGNYSFNKPVFFIECGIHAREWVSPATCMFIIDEMTQKYGRDSSVTALLDKMDFIILPVFNVDGYAYTWKNPKKYKYRMWRKNRRYHPGYGCHGVDLNRNWGYKWGGAGASTYPCDITYRGSKAFSEVETANVRAFLKGLGGKLKGFIDFHSYSQLWFIPWGYTSEDTLDHDEQV